MSEYESTCFLDRNSNTIHLSDFVYKNRDWKTWLAYSLDVSKLVAYYTWKLKWVTPCLNHYKCIFIKNVFKNVIVEKIPPALFEVTEVCFWKGYLPKLLETALLPQFFVLWVRDFKLWLLAYFLISLTVQSCSNIDIS